MRRVVLIGAAGFLGTHARAALERRSGELSLTCIDRLPRSDGAGDWRTLDLLGAPASALRELLADLRPQVVVNCSGALAGDASTLVASNVLLVARLLDAIPDALVRPRFVHLGSAAEYGPCAGAGSVGEDHVTAPTSAYGIAKLAATHLLACRHAEGTIEAIVLRIFNPVGAGMSPHTVLGRAAALMRRAIDAREGHVELGDLSAVRDFVAASDVGELIARACTQPVPDGIIFNVGSGVATPVRDMVQALARIAGYGGVVHERTAGSPRSAAVRGQPANVARARRGFAWTPSADFAPALRALWDAARS